MIRLIAVIDSKRGIAKNSQQPWYIPEDANYFSKKTKIYGANILVGSKTFATFKGPLVERHNYVLTHTTKPIMGVELVHNLEAFLDSFKDKDLWVIGGASLYKQVLDSDLADELYLTHIEADYDCDQFFPPYEDKFKLIARSDTHRYEGTNFYYATYRRTSSGDS